MSKEIYKRIGRNSFYNVLRRLLGFPVGLILPLVVLSYLGVEGYGVWVFIQALVAYSVILDMGSDAVTKYTAEYKSQENHLKIARIFNTFFVLYFFLFVIFFLAVFIYRDWIIDVFIKTDKLPRGDISFTLVLYAAVFGINMIFKVYSSFLNGLERMDLTNKVEMLAVINNFIFSIIFLYGGWGIKGLAVAGGLSTLITGFIYVGVCARVAPYLKLNPFLFSFNIPSGVYKFVSYAIFGGITSMAHFQLNKLIISYFLGIKYLAYYDLGQRLIFAMMVLFGSISIPIMPAASASYASLGIEKIKELFQASFKYITLIVIPVFLFTSVMADRIIFVWLGPGYEEAAFVLRFLSIAYLILLFTGPSSMILTGIGLPNLIFCGGLITAVTSTVLSLSLVVKFGLAGIIISTLLAYTIGTIYFLYYSQKKLGGPVINILKYLKFPFLTSTFILLILSFMGKYIRNYHIELLSATILFPIAYILFVYKNPEYGRIRDFIRRPLSIFYL